MRQRPEPHILPIGGTFCNSCGLFFHLVTQFAASPCGHCVSACGCINKNSPPDITDSLWCPSIVETFDSTVLGSGSAWDWSGNRGAGRSSAGSKQTYRKRLDWQCKLGDWVLSSVTTGWCLSSSSRLLRYSSSKLTAVGWEASMKTWPCCWWPTSSMVQTWQEILNPKITLKQKFQLFILYLN